MHQLKLRYKVMHSVGTKIVLLIVILIIAISAFIFMLFPKKMNDQLINSLDGKVQSIARMTAYSVRAALDFGSVYDIENAISIARQNKDIEYIVLKDALDQVAYAFNQEKADKVNYESAKEGQKISEDGNTYLAMVEVAKDGRSIGSLYIGISMVELKNEIDYVKKMIALVCFLIVIIGIFAAFFISKIVTRPLQRIAATFEDIASGNLSKRAEVNSKDEVGQLAQSFNLMVGSLETAQNDLERSNISLQSEIDEREKTEITLRESEEKYRLLAAELPDLILVHQDELVTYVNNVIFDLLGYQPEELIGNHIFTIICPEYIETAKQNIQKRYEGANVTSYELELMTKNNERVYFETRGTVLSYGNKPATLNVLTNITERKKFEQKLQKANEELENRVAERTNELVEAIEQLQKQIQERKLAEESLRESEEKFKALSEYSSDGIMRFDGNLRHLYVNKAQSILSGIPVEQFIGRTFSELGFPDNLADLWNRAILTVFDTKEPTRIEFENNDNKWVDWSLCPEFTKDGAVSSVLSSARDITDRKKNEYELISAREQALEASRLKSEFLANMSHEIRTPLNGIIGMTNLMMNTSLSEEQLEFAHIIKSSGNVLLNIINDILDFSKIEAGRLELENIDFNLRFVVEEAVEIFAQKAHEKRLELISFVYPEIPSLIKGDPARLKQILINMIGNAIKFTAKGEIVVTARLEKIEDEKAVIYFSVEDSGIGIDKESQEKLFQPFTQADGSTTRKYGGTGLGLSISKRLVEMMNGNIGVSSFVNKGSTFYFTASFEPSSDTEEVIYPLENISGIKVLIVDDNSTNRKILQHQTSIFNMRSDSADNGFDALTALQTGIEINDPYEIAILDQVMPEMNGLELASKIKADESLKNTKIIMLTSFGEITKKTLKQYGLNAYLNKPVKQSSLFDAIANCLGEHAIIDRLEAEHQLENSKLIENAENLNILVAEDNTTNQKVAFHMLKNLGFKYIDIVGNGLEAENAILKADYDIVFMDCQMPERDGFEATRNIRAREGENNKIVIIAMTANALQGDRERCFSFGMNDYISKPINPKTLENIVRKWVAAVTSKENKIDSVIPDYSVPDELALEEITDNDTDELIDIDQINVLKELGGEEDPGLINQFIDTFISDTPADLERLRLAVEKQEPKELKAAAHKVKGASGNIGAKVMQALSLSLEMKGKNNDMTEIMKIFEELMLCFPVTVSALEKYKM